MNAFPDFGVLPDEPELCDKYDYGASRHYKIQILCATAAANAGVNSLWLNDVDCKGLVPSLYDLLQALGRADRKLTGAPGDSEFRIHLSLPSYVSLFIRVMTTKDVAERAKLFDAMHSAFCFLVLPDRCYHSFIESYFEVDNIERPSCGLWQYVYLLS